MAPETVDQRGPNRNISQHDGYSKDPDRAELQKQPLLPLFGRESKLVECLHQHLRDRRYACDGANRSNDFARAGYFAL